MQITKSIFKLSLLVLLSMLILSACKNEESPVSNNTGITDTETALKTIINSDEINSTFIPNYNEEQAISFLMPKVNDELYPVKVGQRMELLSSDLVLDEQGDTAYGTLTQMFSGVLFIVASYEEVDSLCFGIVDTVIEKEFSSVMTRKFIFERVADSGNELEDWRMIATSLPEGGSISTRSTDITESIAFEKVTLTQEDGTVTEIVDPNDTFIYKTHPMAPVAKQGPHFGHFETVLITLEISSIYEADDFVTVTYGATPAGRDRAKRKFALVSSEFDGSYYHKVYEAEFITRGNSGYSHAIINALPGQSVSINTAPVEEASWGIPYRVM